MPSSRAARRVLASWGVALLLVGCALPMQDSNRESPYTGGYGGGGGGGRQRDEYRGPLPAGSYSESCRDMRIDRDRRRLEAECLGRDGRWRDTSLDLRDCDRGIMNADGRLAAHGRRRCGCRPGATGRLAGTSRSTRHVSERGAGA